MLSLTPVLPGPNVHLGPDVLRAGDADLCRREGPEGGILGKKSAMSVVDTLPQSQPQALPRCNATNNSSSARRDKIPLTDMAGAVVELLEQGLPG